MFYTSQSSMALVGLAYYIHRSVGQVGLMDKKTGPACQAASSIEDSPSGLDLFRRPLYPASAKLDPALQSSRNLKHLSATMVGLLMATHQNRAEKHHSRGRGRSRTPENGRIYRAGGLIC